MAIRIPVEVVQQIVAGIGEVAKRHPIISSDMKVFEEQLAITVDVEFLVAKGIDRGPVCVEIAEAFAEHVTIGKFPSFTIQEFEELLTQKGYTGNVAPMHVALYVQLSPDMLVDDTPKMIDDTNYVNFKRSQKPGDETQLKESIRAFNIDSHSSVMPGSTD